MPRYKIILNPTSGRGLGEKSYPLIERELNNNGLEFDIERTESAGHAMQLAQQAAEDSFDVVVAAGGDGTFNEVLNGLMRVGSHRDERPALSVIPIGRGNDFCYGVDIPGSIEAVCQLLAGGECRSIDVGYVQGGDYPDGRYFGNGVGIGFDAVVGFEALKLKKLGGFASYLVAALKTIMLYHKGTEVKIETNGVSYTQQALMVSIMNGRRLGGGFMMAPQGNVGDGQLNLCVAGQVGRLGILALLPRFMQGSQESHPAIAMDTIEAIKVTGLNSGLPAHADGETISTAAQQLEIKILPLAIRVVGTDQVGEV